MSNNSEERRGALFELADDALYVANDGRPFSRLGVIGVCATNISDKKSTREDRYEESDEKLIVAIQKRRVKTYKEDPDLLDEHSNNEEEVSRDYQGRFVWELLQNADDAMGSNDRTSADLIGSKGLGFKSILEITEEPEIHSDPFHFRFSPDKTRQLLKEEGISTDPPKLIFRIPHDCPPDHPKVRELLNGYTTVIRLPFQDQEAHEKARKALDDLEPHFLLLSRKLDTLHIITGPEQGKRLYRIEREGAGLSDGEIALHTPESSLSWKRWWAESESVVEDKKVTVAIALPVENGEAVPFDRELPLPFHVFFPTKESLGVKALVHASFELQQNRKHLRQGDRDNDDKIQSLFGKLLEKVIRDTPPQTALETFGSVQCNDNDEEPLKEIKDLMLKKMRTTPFVPVIGGGKLPPTETKLWKDGLGAILREDEQAVKDAKLVAPELSKLFATLEKLGAQYIGDEEHIRLLQYCRNGSQEECIDSFRGQAKKVLTMDWPRQFHQWSKEDHDRLALLRKVPCWWTDKETSRSLEPKPPLLWKKPDDWPNWLPVDSLHPEFQEEIKKWEEGEISDSYDQPWTRLTEDCLSKVEQHYIDWVLIPAIKGWDQQQWEQQGYDVLKWLEVWEREKPHGFNEPPWIKNDEKPSNRGNLATNLHLPTDKGRWLSAVDCFAGKAWDGPKAFDEFFADREEYGTILPLEKWREDLQKIDKNRWKGLLRWSGVSWEPKVCQTPAFEVKHPLWDYTFYDRLLPGGKNYLIQNFPDCIKEVKNKELIQDIFPILFGLIKNKNATRYYKTTYGKKKYKEPLSSLALKQLEKEAWLPVERSLLESRERIPPKETFLPKKGLRPLLPEVDRSGIDNDHWFGPEGIKNRLHDLGVMHKLPNKASQWHKWMRQLAETSERWPDPQVPDDWKWKRGEGNQLWQAACNLYDKYLERPEWPSLLEDIKIPCVCNKNGQRILSFNTPGEVYWINEPHLIDSTLEREILAHDYNLFIFRLDDGKDPERLGVQKLSDVIEVEPCYEPNPDYENSIKVLSQRYEKRKNVLEKVCNIELPQFGDLQIKIVKSLKLKLKLSSNGKGLGECPVAVESWKSGVGSILIDVANNKWDAFAHALAYRWDGGKHKKHHDALENYFSADRDKFKRRALDKGFTEEALEPKKDSEEEEKPLPGPADDTETTDALVPITEGASPLSLVTGTTHDTNTTEKGGETTDTTKIPNNSGIGGTRTPSGGTGTPSGTDAPIPTTKGAPPPHPDMGNGAKDRKTNFTGEGTPRPESGLLAEKWLGEKLNNEYSEKVENTHRGADFILRQANERKVYIEAKHVESHPGVIHWSKRQYKRAKEEKAEGNSYFIAVLSRVADSDEYAIHWIWDPLADLKNLENRKVVWSGESEPWSLQKGEWGEEKTGPESVPTRTFDIKITLRDSIYREENKDDCRLTRLKEKIRSA